MRVARSARQSGYRRAGWSRDRRANMQVVEVMIVGLLVVAAVVAVSTMNVPVTESEGFKQDNERLAKDSLLAMMNRPSSNSIFGSTLEEYVMEAIAGNKAPLMAYLNKTLPGGAVYNVYLDNHYGPPYPVVEQGQPPREAVAGSIQMVPKLAYTFMIPEFGYYHGDFHMNMYSVPVQNGVLLHDEGEPIELAITFQGMDDDGTYTGDAVTLKTYGHTALRMNDPDARSWPSVAISYWEPAALEHRYLYDASAVPLYGDKLEGGGDAYNLTWNMKLAETANIKVPKNTLLTMEFPRGFDFNATKRDWVANSTGDDGLGNTLYWKDWTWDGHVLEGWIVTAKTKETFRNEEVWLNLSSNFRTAFDTAFPYYAPVTFSLGSGAQGLTHLLIDTPSTPVAGAFGREAFLSLSKPLVSGDTTRWGIGFGNNGERVHIQNITLSHPDGDPLFTDVTHSNGWMTGTWKPTPGKDGSFYWDPDTDAVVEDGSQMWLSLDVVAGTTLNNNYRNQDYLEVIARYNPDNGTGFPNTIGSWELDSRSWRMGEQWVYRDSTVPYDDTPGWPDEVGREYWVTGGTYGYDKVLAGQTDYKVLPTAFTSNAFGDYQGAHVSSRLDVTDRLGNIDRAFALGERVHIRTDFEAIFGELSKIQANGVATVSDLVVRTDVYTPERSWKGVPTASYSQSASIATDFGDVAFLRAADLNADGIVDIIVIGSGGVIYALDGTDGSKFWSITASDDTYSAELVDLDEDGVYELVVGFDDGVVRAYNTKTGTVANRLLWTASLKPTIPWGVGLHTIDDIVHTTDATNGAVDLVFASSAATGAAYVYAVDVSGAGTSWSTTTTATYNASASSPTGAAYIHDLVAVSWAETGAAQAHIALAQADETVRMLRLPTLDLQWIERLPYQADALLAADLDGDGHEEVLADTINRSATEAQGHKVFTLNPKSGDYGPATRSPIAPPVMTFTAPIDAVIMGSLALATTGDAYMLADPWGFAGVEIQRPSISGVFMDNAIGVDSNGANVFVADRDGRVFYASEGDPFDFGMRWNGAISAATGFETRDIHASPSYSTGGSLHVFGTAGQIRSTTDISPAAITWTDVAQLCSHATLPSAGIACAGDLTLTYMHAEEDAAGEATRFWLLSQQADTARLHTYTPATSTWTEMGSWTDTYIATFDVESDGTIWIGGKDLTTDEPLLRTLPPAGAWTDQTLWRNETGQQVTAVLFNTTGTGWAAADDGTIWQLVGDGLWIPFHVEDLPAATNMMLVEDDEGTVWIVSDGFAHAPLATHVRTATAYFPSVTGAIPNDASVRVTIRSEQTQLGGDASAVPEKATLTGVRWYGRVPGGDWAELTAQDGDNELGVGIFTYQGDVPCVPVACTTVELRADLENGWEKTAVSGYRTMGGLSPQIVSYEVDVRQGASGYSDSVTVGPGTLLAGSTAVYSETYAGAALPRDRLPWSFQGFSDFAVLGAQRHVAVSTTSVLDGDGRPDVFITQANGAAPERWVLNATNGRPEIPTDLLDFGLYWADRIDHILVVDIVGDDKEDLVMAGTFDGVKGSLRAWDVFGGADHDLVGSGSDIYALIDSGIDSGRRTLAHGGSDRYVSSTSGNLAGNELQLRWTTSPADAQGKATFEYEIPLDAMYGTGVVVSELTFTISQGGTDVTQTARLVDWFNMHPPDREVPRPPIYTIQIVSWFNEA